MMPAHKGQEVGHTHPTPYLVYFCGFSSFQGTHARLFHTIYPYTASVRCAAL